MLNIKSRMLKQSAEIISLEQFYEMYKNQVYTLCIRLTNSKILADDLFSATWEQVAEKYRNIRHDKNPMGWIFSVCINIYRKSAKKQKLITLSENVKYECSQLFSTKNKEDLLIDQETRQQLQQALNSLKDKYRIPIILFYFKEMSYNEISKIMKLPMSTVKFRLNHAKKLLKQLMEEAQ